MQAGQTLDPAAWNVTTQSYPHPALDSSSLVGNTLGPFLFAANMFGFIVTVSLLPKLLQECKMRVQAELPCCHHADASD